MGHYKGRDNLKRRKRRRKRQLRWALRRIGERLATAIRDDLRSPSLLRRALIIEEVGR